MKYYGLVEMAQDIINMQEELEYLRGRVAELEEVEKKYNKLVYSSLEHSQQMVGNTIKMLLTPGVAEAFAENANSEDFT